MQVLPPPSKDYESSALTAKLILQWIYSQIYPFYLLNQVRNIIQEVRITIVTIHSNMEHIPSLAEITFVRVSIQIHAIFRVLVEEFNSVLPAIAL